MTTRKSKEVSKLKGLEEVTEFLKIILSSGKVAEAKPLSCLVVAPVSSGKTLSIKQFSKNQSVYITTDSTAWGLLKDKSKELEQQKVTHIIIPDLLNTLARRKETRDKLILFINSSSEDGLFPSTTYGMEIKTFIKPFGWILCLPSDAFKSNLKKWREIGFISRFFILRYQYDLVTLSSILDDIIHEKTIKSIPSIKIPQSKKLIKGNPKIFRELELISKLMVKQGESDILRMQTKLQTFLKANALLRGDNEVKQEDLETLKRLIHLIT